MRRVLASALGVLCLVGVALARPTATAETFKPFTFKTVEGKDLSLSEVLGKVTLVGFFYPSCKYCNAAYPEIQKLYDAYKDRGLSVVWINVLPEENRLVAGWRAQHASSIPVLIGGRAVQRDYKIEMTPTHFLLDSAGRVLSKKAGFAPGDEKTLEQDIQAALK
jgi:thiol-disulfide isomerase/thioredoxin